MDCWMRATASSDAKQTQVGVVNEDDAARMQSDVAFVRASLSAFSSFFMADSYEEGLLRPAPADDPALFGAYAAFSDVLPSEEGRQRPLLELLNRNGICAPEQLMMVANSVSQKSNNPVEDTQKMLNAPNTGVAAQVLRVVQLLNPKQPPPPEESPKLPAFPEKRKRGAKKAAAPLHQPPPTPSAPPPSLS